MVKENKPVTELKPPQVLRERVRREHDAALTPRSSYRDMPIPINREHLAELLKPETLRRNADSLPVLAAFQEFLDVERRRTRARMLALTMMFLIILLAAGGVAFLVGVTFYRKTQEQATAMQANLDAIRTQVQGGQEGTLDALAILETRAGVLESSFDQQMATFDVGQRGLTAQLDGLNTNVAGLNGTIARLQNENAQLQHRLQQNTIDWASVTNRVEEIMSMLAHAPPPVADELPTVQGEHPTPTAPPVMPQRKSIVLAIIPKGGTYATDWRIPLSTIQE